MGILQGSSAVRLKPVSKKQWLLLFVALLIVGSLLAINIYHGYITTINQEQDRLSAQNRVVRENLLNSLETIDKILALLQKELAHENTFGSSLNSRLKILAGAIPGARTIHLTDAKGIGRAASRPEVIIGRDFSFRDYFTVPRKHPEREKLYISNPFKTLTGIHAMNATKVLFDTAGDFAGIATVTLDPDYFKTLLSSVNYSEDMRTSIIHYGGTVFMVAPDVPGLVGNNAYRPGSFFTMHRDGSSMVSVKNGWSELSGRSALMVIATATSEHLKIDNPVVVTTDRSMDVLLERWRHDAVIKGVLFGAMTILLPLGLMFHRRRQEEYERYAAEVDRERMENAERLSLAIGTAGVGIWEYLPESGRLVWDETMYSIYGVDRLTFPSVYDGWRAALIPEDLPEAESAVMRAIETKGSLDFVFRIRKDDGGIRHIRSVARVIENREGNAVRMIGTNEDITERRLAEENLQHYRLLVDNSNDAIYSKTLDGTVITWNSSAERLYGYTAEEIIGKNVSMLFDRETPDQMALLMEKISRGETVEHYETVRVRKNGEKINVSLTLSPIVSADGVIREVSMIARNITERIKMEEYLKESRQLLSDIIDFLPDSTFVIDNDMKVIAWNRAMEEMTGIAKEEILGKGDHTYTIPFYGQRRKQLLDLLDLSDAELESKYQNVQRKGSTLYAETFAPKLYGGTGAYLWVSGAPLYSAEGRRIGAIEVIRDISDRKKVEQDLVKAKSDADLANRAKSDFLANMSHEIRTPMNAITGMAYLALQTDLAPKQREYVTRIRSAANSLLDIINDLLDFSKIEAGKMELESVSFSIDEIFRSLQNIFASKAEEKNLKLVMKCSPGVPERLVGDPLRIGQILNNLISNAIKFTESGSVELDVSGSPDSSVPDRAAVTFRVRDTGIGMESGQLERIFMPFAQADSSITRRFGGSGLGLSIVSNLTALMGSELKVFSEPGQGSTFSFSLTLGIECSHKRRKPELPPELKGERVLVVDDSRDTCAMLESMLEELGLRHASAESGISALEELERAGPEGSGDPYRVVIVDWRMPGMDGLETARRIRQGEALYGAPELIIISGYVAEDIKEEAEKTGVREILTKPFNLPELLDGILGALGKRVPVKSDARSSLTPAEPPKQLQGARVLLAEDDRVNQIVAREIMKRFGVDVVVAENGREAVRSVLEEGPFDMVLMDIQMPEMNGYEASVAIRSVKGELELPVIALTAHALTDERDKCRESGMNDHLAKPIDPDQLYSVMLKWMPRRNSIMRPMPENGSFSADEGTEFPEKLPGIDLPSVLERCGGNRGLVKDIIISFRDDKRDVGQEIRHAIESGDTGRAAFLVHSVKGLSATIGAVLLSSTMSGIETALANGNSPLLGTLLSKAEVQFREVFSAADTLEKIPLEQDPDEFESPMDVQEFTQSVEDLLQSLRNNDLSALRLFERMKYGIPPKERELIRKQIAALDFKGAVASLVQVARSSGIDIQGGDDDT